jgi:hypothetical protein
MRGRGPLKNECDNETSSRQRLRAAADPQRISLSGAVEPGSTAPNRDVQRSYAPPNRPAE